MNDDMLKKTCAYALNMMYEDRLTIKYYLNMYINVSLL
jgi:hypothetical protein